MPKSDTPEKELTKPKIKAMSDADIHAEARSRFSALMSLEFVRERDYCLEDRKFAFVPGAQWDDYDDEEDNTIKLEMNATRKSMLRIQSDFRNNPITVDFVASDDAQNDDLADVCDGLFRNDVQQSGGQEAFNAAFEEGSAGGVGAFRLTSVYEDEDDEDNDKQRIAFEPIYDADQTAFFDPNARRQDKRDGMWCLLLSKMTKEEYELKYGENPSSWPESSRIYGGYDYVTSSDVRILEYFRIEKDTRKIVTFTDQEGNERKIDEADLEDIDLLTELASGEWEELGTRTMTTRKVMKYILSGNGVIERGQRLPGKYLPIIPFYGHRVVVDGIERTSGHIRIVKDAQRLENIQFSNLAELASKSPSAKPIVTPEQIAGHGADWASDAKEDHAYLQLNAMTDAAGNPIPAGPIAYTRPPEVPPAIAALIQTTGERLKTLLGNEGSEEVVSNIAGDVVEQIHARLDMATYMYVSNMAVAMEHCGRVWLSMAQDLYVEPGRAMKTVTKTKETNTVKLGQKTDKDGEITVLTLKGAKLTVGTDVAPASSSRRSSTVRNVMRMMKVTQDPEMLTTLSLMAIMNLDGEGLSGLRDHARMKLVRMGVEKPSDEEAAKLKEEAQSQKPDAAHDLLVAEKSKTEAEVKVAESRALEATARAKKYDAEAKIEFARLSIEERQQVLDMMDKMDVSEKQAAPVTPQSSGEI